MSGKRFKAPPGTVVGGEDLSGKVFTANSPEAADAFARNGYLSVDDVASGGGLGVTDGKAPKIPVSAPALAPAEAPSDASATELALPTPKTDLTSAFFGGDNEPSAYELQQRDEGKMRSEHGAYMISPDRVRTTPSYYVPMATDAIKVSSDQSALSRAIMAIDKTYRDALLVNPGNIYHDMSDDEAAARLESSNATATPLAIQQMKDNDYRMALAQARHKSKPLYRAAEINGSSPEYMQKSLALSKATEPLGVLTKGFAASRSLGTAMPLVREVVQQASDRDGMEGQRARQEREISIEQEDRIRSENPEWDFAGRMTGGVGTSGASNALARGADKLMKAGASASKAAPSHFLNAWIISSRSASNDQHDRRNSMKALGMASSS